MDMLRPFFGFVAGFAVAIGLFVAGLLDGIPHWSREHAHWSGVSNPADPEPARYRISADYQNGSGSSDDERCPPRFEFHNNTKHPVTFSSDGYDDTYPGTAPKTGKGYISTTPDQGFYGPPSKSNGQQDYRRQDYGPPDDASSNGGSQDFGPGGDYDSGSQYGAYDNDYPGPYRAGCSPGVVEIYMDRNK